MVAPASRFDLALVVVSAICVVTLFAMVIAGGVYVLRISVDATPGIEATR